MPKQRPEFFQIQQPDRFDKEFIILGPGNFQLFVDYDDVDHEQQMKDAEQVVAILNAHWVEPEDDTR